MDDYNLHVDSFDENCWAELLDCGGLVGGEVPLADLYWNPQPSTQEGRNDQCGGTGTKACRERMRREKLKDRFLELCAILEPGRPVKSDKSAILGDAIRVLNQLKNEIQEYKEMNEKLLDEVKTLKGEKNELREEKLALKADKEKMEQQWKTLGSVYPPPNKMPLFPSYSYIPMLQYMPLSARDTSQDHHLRPPAA